MWEAHLPVVLFDFFLPEARRDGRKAGSGGALADGIHGACGGQCRDLWEGSTGNERDMGMVTGMSGLEEGRQAHDSRKHDPTDLETYLRRPWPPFRGQLMGFHDRQNLGDNEDRRGIQ